MISLRELKLVSTGILAASILGTLICVAAQKTINRKYSWENLIIDGNNDNESKGYRFPYLTEENKGRFIYDQNKYKKLVLKNNVNNPKEGHMLRNECFLLLKEYSFDLDAEERCLFKVDGETEKFFNKYLNRLGKLKKNSGQVYLEIIKENSEQINYFTDDFEETSQRFNNGIEQKIEEELPESVF